MDIQKLILESRKLNRDYDKRLSILRDASYDILNGNQLPYSEKDLKAFLLHVYTVESEAEDAYRMVMTNEQGAIADEMNKVCYQIIKKYGVDNLRLKSSFTRLVAYAETDPEKTAELEEELTKLLKELWKTE